MTQFPEKLYCTSVGEGEERNIWAYEEIKTAAEGDHAVRVGIYTLTEVVEARLIETVETVKVEG